MGWIVDHAGLVMPALFVTALAFYGLVLGLPPLRARVLRRLPCLATHTVRVVLEHDDPATLDAALAELRVLTSHGRWSPAPPSYHVQTTIAVAAEGGARRKETVLLSTSYNLRRNRGAAEARLGAYVTSLGDQLDRGGTRG